MPNTPVIPVVTLGIGLYLAWFGVHYWDSTTKWPTDPVKAVLTGKGIPTPTGQTSAASVATEVEAQTGGSSGATGSESGSSGFVAPGTPTGTAIASLAQQYVGKGYAWGGPADVPGNWDCSSFCSYVLGHDLGLTLPGGGKYGDAGYPPHAHGPTTLNYLMFGTPVNYGKEQPGDLLVTTEHMGIVIGGGKMVSAQDPQLGTGIGSYGSGFPGGQPFVRRVG
jgi:cell wall-associated NlpC family hydrolase